MIWFEQTTGSAFDMYGFHLTATIVVWLYFQGSLASALLSKWHHRSCSYTVLSFIINPQCACTTVTGGANTTVTLPLLIVLHLPSIKVWVFLRKLCFLARLLESNEVDISSSLPYSGKLSREKTHEFRGFESIHESFLHKNRWPHPHISGGAKQSTKFFSANFLLPPVRQSFLPWKFPTIR